MPTVEGSKKDLEKLVGKKFSSEELKEAVLYAKGEMEELKGDKIVVDVKDSNRPDLWSIEGIARALKGAYGKEKGIPKYKTGKAKEFILVEKKVEKVRPCIAGAIVRKVKVSEEFLVQMIQLQEKVANSFGRKRKEAAIGIYDFDKIKTPIKYTTFKPKELKFIPLEYKTEMDLEEILQEHPKGKEFAFLLKDAKEYPIVIDSKKQVCSMPPIINSNYTGKVSQKTKNLFVEVTGFNQKTVNTALNVMASAFAERGFKVEKMKVKYKKKGIETPDFKAEKMELEEKYFQEISGLKLKGKEIAKLLEKARINAKAGKKIKTEIPSYRNDVLHPIDLVEDALIVFGYNKIEPEEVKVYTLGKEREETKNLEMLREVGIGLGLQEVVTFVSTSKQKQLGRIGVKEEIVEIENPVSENYAVLRKRIFPELLEFIAKNKDVTLPQKVFEIGKVVKLKKGTETGTEEKTKACIALTDSQLNFNDIKSVLQSLEKMLGIKTELKEFTVSYFIEGRSALIERKGKAIGEIGEIHPKVLEEFGISNPVALMELEV